MAHASRGMSAAVRAAKEPVGPAQAKGAGLVKSATGTEIQALQAVRQVGATDGISPLPVAPSGVNTDPLNIPYQLGNLPVDFEEIRKYLNILYPFTTPDPQDAYWQRRTSVVNREGTIPGVGKAIAPPEYFDYCQRKLNQNLSDQFKSFVFSQIKLDTPAAREYWESRFPEYTNEFRQGWQRRLGHMAKMGEMLINGVQSTDDLWYLFVTEKGLNPVAFQYNGPPNSSQVAAMANMYQQTVFGARANVPREGRFDGFGQGDLNSQYTGQILGTQGNQPQVYGQQPAGRY